MSKRKPLDKEQLRERRNRLLESAAAAELSLTEGVREMRAISGMTQEEFARHRGVSARVIKALELGQGNPTVATLNSIGEFFGLKVGFVPVKRSTQGADQPNFTAHPALQGIDISTLESIIRKGFDEAMAALQTQSTSLQRMPPDGAAAPSPAKPQPPDYGATSEERTRTRKKSRPSS